MNEKIIITGAKEHNLKNVSLELPKNELIVFTGVSGSGKSSLAFDTIFAEGQRRYVESLSTYARQFLGQMDKPNVEHIEGLSPSISIDQKSTSNNPRSTVGTVTEIYDYLRLLYARIGTPYCPECGDEIKPQTIDEIVDKILGLGEGAKIQILAPIARGKKGEFQSTFEELRQEGFVRVKVDGQIFNLDEDEIKLEKNIKHTIHVVVDRIVVKDEAISRIADSVQIALKKADGIIIVDVVEYTPHPSPPPQGGREQNLTNPSPLAGEGEFHGEATSHRNLGEGSKEIIFSEKLSCPKCNLSFEELAPRIFSFNNPYGACERCSGLGADNVVNPNLVIPDRKKSLSQGAIYPWAKTTNQYYADLINSVCEYYGIDKDKSFEDLTQDEQNIILYGGDDELIKIRVKDFVTKRYGTHYMKFPGVINYLEKKYKENIDSEYWSSEIQKYMITTPCTACGGARLKPFPLAVKINDKNIYEFTLLPIDEAFNFISDLFLELSDYQMKIAKQVLEEIRDRLKFLLDVGLNYLTLARMAGTLSGGEAQRIRLATQIGSGLSGVLYVLDEPSIGLHQRDNDRLIQTLIKLRNLGNTLIVVEHDEETIKHADYIVDIGPNAGINGGEIVAKGSIDDIVNCKKSITGKYLSGEKTIPVPQKKREGSGHFLRVKNARLNNLKNIDVDVPLGRISVLTGVSGSGKSTLMQDLIYEYAKYKLLKNKPKPQGIDEIEGFEHIDKVIDIDQSPIGRTPRSNPATYTDVFTHIRDLYSRTNEARVRGYKPGRFSFNVKGGRCEACKGDGVLKIEMNFLSDVYVKCDVCKGKRYNRETLEVKYKGKTISDVLEMSVGEALEFFENIPSIKNKLKTLNDVGLDYIKLGQSATTLSGGEAQRIKLASELNKRATGKTLYLLDEPSVGLHWYDLDKLIKILQKLADSGNTILIIEHNMDLIKIADYIIDLGPEGGNAGGEIVATGSPKEVSEMEKSHTGKYLKKVFNS
ncbi:MAG TPA: excinuclease ABC subunit UvrA [Candidatus Gastranaerophilaceae bacterium]|nr:excinuclease ABC subunit UvrA [Candidatus Gastranaerophilaceae bacterium]HPT41974.1 excinuclease ABC subunit UvrA [Candidatus Gastranaerophilaceae bacterium]